MDYTDKIVSFMLWIGGDTKRAFSYAERKGNVQAWIYSQKLQAGLIGAGAMIFPFVHLVALIFDFLFVIHKMTYVCWGIAHLHGSDSVSKDDLRVILAHWSGEIGDDMLDVDVFESKDQINEMGVLGSLGDQVFKMLLRNMARRSAQGGAIVSAKVGVKAGAKAGAKVASKAGTKLSLKYLSKLSIKFLSKIFFGFLPILGAVIALSINRNLVDGIAKSAVKYYSTVQKHMSPLDRVTS